MSKRKDGQPQGKYINAIHAEVEREYCWPRMCENLWREACGRGRSASGACCSASGKRKFVVTADSKHDLATL